MRILILSFVFSLMLVACGPSDFEKQKLAFEVRKYNDEQAAKADAAQKEAEDKKEQGEHWRACRFAADADYDSEFKLWGRPVSGKPGVRSGPEHQLQEMKNRLRLKTEQCDRNFPKGISW
jgi:hypothetical protein